MKKILVVDNDEDTATVIERTLALAGNYKTDIASGGQEALNKMKKNGDYDLVVLDLMMPKVSGIDVCKAMTKDKGLSKISVLIVSALPVDSEVFQESQGKFNELKVIKDTLEKPFEIDILLDKVRAILSDV